MKIEKNRKIPNGHSLFSEENFQTLWNKAIKVDNNIQIFYNCLSKGERSFPPALKHLKVSLAECSFDARGALTFGNRFWIPDYEPLQKALIQQTHDSYVT